MKLQTIIADTLTMLGIGMFLAGLYLVWLPLPLIIGGFAAITFGIVLDRGSRK